MNTKYSEEQGDGSFMKHLILASGSPRRRELMSQVGLDFTVVTSDADERKHDPPDPGPCTSGVYRCNYMQHT